MSLWPILEGDLAGSVIVRLIPVVMERVLRTIVGEGGGGTMEIMERNSTRGLVVRLVRKTLKG